MKRIEAKANAINHIGKDQFGFRKGANILDRLYVNTPCYSTVRVLESTVKSDHKAIVAYSDHVHVQPLNKRRHRQLFRRRSPTQHARFLDTASMLNIELDGNADAQTNFDIMYGVMFDLLDTFYPERENARSR